MKKLVECNYYCDTFKTNICLLIGDHDRLKGWSKRGMSKKRRAEFVDLLNTPEDCVFGRAYCIGGGCTIIWLKPDRTPPLAVLAHEIVHAVTHLCRSRNIPVSDDTDEVVAYLVECLFTAFAPTVTKYCSSKKKR